MKSWRFVTVLIVITAGMSLAQTSNPPAQTSPSTSTQEAGSAAAPDNALRGPLPLVLSKSLDSKKLKAGDPVLAQTAVGLRGQGIDIPKGSKVVGHVTQAQARSKGDPQSALALAFDKIEVGKGQEMPMKGVLQAVAPEAEASPGADTGAAGPGTLPGHGDTSTMPAPSQGSVAGPNSGDSAHPMLNPQAQGVVGYRNLQMDNNSVLTSTGKEVKLDSGTQMIVRAEIQPQASGPQASSR